MRTCKRSKRLLPRMIYHTWQALAIWTHELNEQNRHFSPPHPCLRRDYTQLFWN